MPPENLVTRRRSRSFCSHLPHLAPRAFPWFLLSIEITPLPNVQCITCVIDSSRLRFHPSSVLFFDLQSPLWAFDFSVLFKWADQLMASNLLFSDASAFCTGTDIIIDGSVICAIEQVLNTDMLLFRF